MSWDGGFSSNSRSSGGMRGAGPSEGWGGSSSRPSRGAGEGGGYGFGGGGRSSSGNAGGGTYRGYTPAQVSHLSSIGLGGQAFGTDARNAAAWAARQQAAARTPATVSMDKWGLGYAGVGGEWGALNDALEEISKSDLSTLDKQIASASANFGNITGLKALGVDTSGMEKAYGGLMGTIGKTFGKDIEDVETPAEAVKSLVDKGYASLDEKTGQLTATPSGQIAAMSTPLGTLAKLGGGLIGGALMGPIGGMAGSYLGGKVVPSDDYSGGLKTAGKLAGLGAGLMGAGGPASAALQSAGGLASDIGLSKQMQLAGIRRGEPVSLGLRESGQNNLGIIPSGTEIAQAQGYDPYASPYIDYSNLYL